MSMRCVIVVVCAHLAACHPFHSFAADGADRATGQQTATTPALDAPLLDNAWDGLSQLGGLTRGLAESAVGSNRAAASEPEAYVWVRISKDYLANHVEREVDREGPARDRILGITFVGRSRTTGATRLVLHPSDEGAAGRVLFEGYIESRTTGRKGPATLHYLSQSDFRAHKPLAITDRGLETGPAQAEAPTRLTPIDISISRPGLPGRIARRIAWRRAAQSQAEADAIASDHRARDIRERLDQRLNEAVASIQAEIESALNNLQLSADGEQPTVHSRSTPDFVEVALLPARLDRDRFQVPEFQVAADADLAIRVHRSVIARVIANPQLHEKFSVLAPGLVGGPAKQGPGRDQQSFAVDSGWLALDVTKPAASITPLRVGTASDDQQRLR